jgi:hypothetical protein
MKTFEQWMDAQRPHWRTWLKGRPAIHCDATARLMLEAWNAAAREHAQELESLRAFKRGVDEALNSGDGVYRP